MALRKIKKTTRMELRIINPPKKMYDAVRQLSEEGKRSITKQMEYLLEQSPEYKNKFDSL